MINYEEVNKAIKKVIDYLYSIENVWNKERTLKLRDLFYDLEEIAEKHNIDGIEEHFNNFCFNEYGSFLDWMDQEGITDRRSYIGRTSSFYLTDVHDIRKIYVFYNLCSEVCSGFMYLDFSEDAAGNIVLDKLEKEDLELARGEIEYIIKDDFLEDVKEFFSDAIRQAEYIDGFLKNQISIFEEYLTCYLEIAENPEDNTNNTETAA